MNAVVESTLELVVTPFPSPKRRDQVVARVGKQLCFFENGTPVPDLGTPVSVMMTRPLYRKVGDGMYRNDELVAVLIRVVQPDDVLVWHQGFECAGSMCVTSAHLRYEGRNVMLTPGLSGVYVADNVNATFNAPDTVVPLRPGPAYVKADDLKKSKARIQGLVRREDLAYGNMFRV
jgi:hypothetical protein